MKLNLVRSPVTKTCYLTTALAILIGISTSASAETRATVSFCINPLPTNMVYNISGDKTTVKLDNNTVTTYLAAGWAAMSATTGTAICGSAVNVQLSDPSMYFNSLASTNGWVGSSFTMNLSLRSPLFSSYKNGRFVERFTCDFLGSKTLPITMGASSSYTNSSLLLISPTILSVPTTLTVNPLDRTCTLKTNAKQETVYFTRM